MMLISEGYKELLRKHREVQPMWGAGGKRHIPKIQKLVDEHHFESVLDYGCGHGVILQYLQAPLKAGYDPGMPEYANTPELPFDMVISTDVLEHIEPELLDNVLDHIQSLTRRFAYLCVCCREARHILPDGRNAHLIVEDENWWLDKLLEHFHTVDIGWRKPRGATVTFYATP